MTLRLAGALFSGLTLFFSFLPLAASAAESQTLNVKVKEVKLRAQPQLWAKSTGTARYGDSLAMLSAEGAWFKVKASSGQGYVHTSAVTDRKVVIAARSGTTPLEADSSDVVLAGKGFNKAVEEDYASKNPGLNFRAVNEMEAVKVPESEVVSFMRSGKLGKGKV